MGLDLGTLVSQNYLVSGDHARVWGDYKNYAIQNVAKHATLDTCSCTELSLSGVELEDWFITPKKNFKELIVKYVLHNMAHNSLISTVTRGW